MKPGWTKCTSANDGKADVFVNLAATTHIFQDSATRTRIYFVGGSESYIDVRETPQDILEIRSRGLDEDARPEANTEGRATTG